MNYHTIETDDVLWSFDECHSILMKGGLAKTLGLEPNRTYVIPKGAIVPVPADRRLMTDEERARCAKPACAKYWDSDRKAWRPADNHPWHCADIYTVPKNHVWAEDAPEMIEATDEVRRDFEMPEGALYFSPLVNGDKCLLTTWDRDRLDTFVTIRYPADDVLVPRRTRCERCNDTFVDAPSTICNSCGEALSIADHMPKADNWEPVEWCPTCRHRTVNYNNAQCLACIHCFRNTPEPCGKEA